MKKLILFLLLVIGCASNESVKNTGGCDIYELDLCRSGNLQYAEEKPECKLRRTTIDVDGSVFIVSCFKGHYISNDSFKCAAVFKGDSVCFRSSQR